jgi:hypothetical protein
MSLERERNEVKVEEGAADSVSIDSGDPHSWIHNGDFV